MTANQTSFQKGHTLNRGRQISPEHREKLSKAGMGRIPWNKGIKMSEDQKKNMKGFPKGSMHPRWRDGLPLQRYKELVAGRPRPDRCEVCDREDIICWDHDHETKRFRGWLCKKCNTALGLTADNPEILRGLAKYLDDSKKEEMGGAPPGQPLPQMANQLPTQQPMTI